jgi:hypothetical protein
LYLLVIAFAAVFGAVPSIWKIISAVTGVTGVSAVGKWNLDDW